MAGRQLDIFLRETKQIVALPLTISPFQYSSISEIPTVSKGAGGMPFLFYINDVTHQVDVQLFLLADDASLYRPITNLIIVPFGDI